MPATRFVVLYKPNPEAFDKAGGLFPAHIAHSASFHSQGKLLSFGPFSDIVAHGSFGIFTSKEAAEEFVANDPFVKEGVVATHEIREWTDTLA